MKTVKVPKACQTQVTLIPKEMMEGIKVTDKQLQMFAKILGNKYIDIVIPLSEPEQIIEGCPIDHESEQAIEHSIYWITPSGSHGWCCEKCGFVIQWG